MTTQLSVIIVNYNVQHFLKLCLQSVRAAIAPINAEIIVVDNDSKDGSCRMLQQYFPEVILIANDTNVGFSTANNKGVAVAKGEYVCILNPDTVVSETTFTEAIAFARKTKNIGALGIQLRDGTGVFLPESKRQIPTMKVALNKFLGNGHAYYAAQVGEEQTAAVPILVGAFMFLKRSVYEEVGGFDERYFMYGEDIDLSYTLLQKGYANYYLGSQKIIHFKGESTAKDGTYRRRFFGAMELFYKKHFSSNLVDRLLVKVATNLFALSRKQNLPPKRHLTRLHAVISENEDLQQQLRKALQDEVVLLSKENIQPNCQVFIDLEWLSFAEAISLIASHQNENIAFKFIPKNSTFAVGSDSSNHQGEILRF